MPLGERKGDKKKIKKSGFKGHAKDELTDGELSAVRRELGGRPVCRTCMVPTKTLYERIGAAGTFTATEFRYCPRCKSISRI